MDAELAARWSASSTRTPAGTGVAAAVDDKSTRQLSAALTGRGHRCSDWLVRRLLHDAGYCLQAAAKQIEGTQHPDRDARFRYVNDQCASVVRRGSR